MAKAWESLANWTPDPVGSLASLFEEEPVPLDVFISDSKYLGQDWMLSPIQYEAVRHIERVYLPELYPIMKDEWGEYWTDDIRPANLITLQWGKGSGKDHVCRIASLRVAYMLMCLKSPQTYFEMPVDDSIHLLNIAANSGQANRAFFTPMTKIVKKGWFADKADPKRDTIQYAKNIEAVSGHSDAEGQEGLNIMLGVADEIDAFKAKDEMVGQGKRAREASTSAEGILKMLKGSASTRFPYSYKRVAISYPRYLGSTIQRLTAEAEEDIKAVGKDSNYFVSGPFATWEVNPRVKGKEAFAQDYRRDPEEAAAMYECKPSRATDAYFRNMTMFREAVTEGTQPITVSYEEVKSISKYDGQMLTEWKPKFTFLDSFKPKSGANYAMHGDLAIRGDRAGIAMSHVERWEERVDIVLDEEGGHVEVVTNVPIVKNDFTIAFESDLTIQPTREIQISWARELCFELRKRGFHIVRFTFDGFQSADTMQILESHGIESERVSLDRDDSVYKNLRDVAYGQRLHMPWNQLLFNELEALSRIDNGKVDHPPNGSKDLSDAFAGSVLGAIVSGGEETSDEAITVGQIDFFMGDALNGLAAEDMGFSLNEFGNLLGTPIGLRGFGNGFN